MTETILSLLSTPGTHKEEGSFQLEGPRLFNSLPRSVREQNNIELLNHILDQFITSIPDQPKGKEATPSATVKDWFQMLPGDLMNWSLSTPSKWGDFSKP